jgi:hypothetical protein
MTTTALIGFFAALNLQTATCQPRLQVPAEQPVASWFGTELATGGRLQETLSVRISGAAGCSPLSLGVEATPLNQPDSTAVVRTSPNGAEVGAVAGGGLALLPVAADAQGNTVVLSTLQWSAQGTPFEAGTARLRLRWRLFDSAALIARPIAQADSQLLVSIPAVLDVQLVAAGRRTPLAGTQTRFDLGELSTGTVHRLAIEVSGNAMAQLSIDQRWGELRIPERSGWHIPYALSIDGRPVVGGASLLLQRRGMLSQAELEIRIGDVERRAAGHYEDTLTLTVAAE